MQSAIAYGTEGLLERDHVNDEGQQIWRPTDRFERLLGNLPPADDH
jgi:hypothetical protein